MKVDNNSSKNNVLLEHIDVIRQLYEENIAKDFPPPTTFFNSAFKNKDNLQKLCPKSNTNKIIDKIGCCEHKINALNYHFKNFIKLENMYISKFKDYNKKIPVDNLTFAGSTPNLVFEFEAFITQFKSCLDIFSQSIGLMFNQRPLDLKALKNVLKDNKTKNNALKLLNLLNKNKDWLSEFEVLEGDRSKRTQRTQVIHYGTINLGTLNVIKRKNKSYSIIRLKNKEISVKEYMENNIKNIERFLEESYKIALSL